MLLLLQLLSISVSVKPSLVYFTKQITPSSITKLYKLLKQPLKGRIGVKISTGEKGGNNWLHPELIGDFVQHVNGTIVECNTFYIGERDTSEKHWKVIEEHGFLNVSKCDILDEEGEIGLPVKNGKFMNDFYVGNHVLNYDSFVILSHFKGHSMGGFGGALKNIAIGFGSARGKGIVHSAGNLNPTLEMFETTPQMDFLETMAEAVSAFIDKTKKENLVYISVAYNLSVDCDCDSNPAPPEMENIGVFASLDPVAIDQACVDAVYNSPDNGKISLIHRMEEKIGSHILEKAEEFDLGSRKYELIEVD